jgi:choline dehydrogenase-like flavoprotein
MFIDRALGSRAKIVNRARVTKVIIEDRCATGVEFRKFGTSYRAYADTIIISAGGIGSPVILRASGIKEAGYRYFFDPLVTVMGTIKDLTVAPLIPMSTGLLCEEEGYMMTDMYYPPLLFFLNHVAGFRFHRLFAQPRSMQIMVKIKDSLGGRLTNRGDVIKVLNDKDRSKLLHGYDRARRILTRAGAKGIFKGWVIAGHPGGTVKINHLLDANLKAEYDNLYVCDCSVIPEAWGLPPTFTLVCLAKRLAKHLVVEAGPK